MQVIVTGYGPVDDPADATCVIGRQRSMGSGVIIACRRLIVTNAHVVGGAQRVQVVVPALHKSEPVLRSLTAPGVDGRGAIVESRRKSIWRS